MQTVNSLDIIEAIRDPKLISGQLGEAQEVCLRLLYGLNLTPKQRVLAKKYSDAWDGRSRDFREAVFICGRRSGKSDRLAANVAVYEAVFGKHEKHLSIGERAWVMCIAASKKQAIVVLNYIKGKLASSPLLKTMIQEERAEEIDLTNGISIGVYPCSFRTIRGVSVCCGIADELAFWRVEGVNVDSEVLSALRPGLATFSNSKLIAISSPYAEQGELYSYFRNRHKNKNILVWRAPSKIMNPTISDRFLEREKERDIEAYRREWLAEFSSSISSFLPADKVNDCVAEGRLALPYADKFNYVASLDAAFKGDTFTFCVAHRDGDKTVIDRLAGWTGSRRSPVNLDVVLNDMVALLKEFHVYRIYGDQYCSEPLRQALQKRGVTFEEVPFYSGLKGKIYTSLKHQVIQGGIELLDHKQSIKELRALECRLTSGGNMLIGAPDLAGYHDDYATVIALAAWQCVLKGTGQPRVRVL